MIFGAMPISDSRMMIIVIDFLAIDLCSMIAKNDSHCCYIILYHITHQTYIIGPNSIQYQSL